MRFRLNLYRSLLITSFLAVNALLLFGIASTWSFLNTGADKATILHTTAKIESVYQPKVQWTVTGQRGRIMEKQTLEDIENDYKSAWYVKYNALASNNPFGLADYYTQDALIFLNTLLDHNRAQKTYFRGTSINHHPELLFYSLDGKVVVFTDNDVETFEEAYVEDTLVLAKTSTHSYQITMVLEDGIWRIRQMVQIAADTTVSKTVSVADSTLQPLGIRDIRGINYYPQRYPWDMFGSHFDDTIISQDFARIREIGFNSVRIFVPYEAFGVASVEEHLLVQLRSVLDKAGAHNLTVLVTLFDFYGNYDVSDWTLTHRHAECIVGALKDHPALLGWDLKNEPDLDFEARGKEKVCTWLSALARQLKSWDPNHPITIGWSTPEAAVTLADKVDFVSFHYYEAPSLLPERYQKLKETVRPKPVVLEEYGSSSYSGIWNGFTGSEENQAEYVETIQKVIQAEQLPSYLWTLYDFEAIPNQVAGPLPWRKTKQKYFGLISIDGQSKAAYSIFRNRKGSR